MRREGCGVREARTPWNLATAVQGIPGQVPGLRHQDCEVPARPFTSSSQREDYATQREGDGTVKMSKRNQANLNAKRERLSAGKPKMSKYEAKLAAESQRLVEGKSHEA